MRRDRGGAGNDIFGWFHRSAAVFGKEFGFFFNGHDFRGFHLAVLLSRL